MTFDEQADLILHGGKLTTLDPANPEATAIAVKGDRIVTAGELSAYVRRRCVSRAAPPRDQGSLASSRATDVACHSPPRAIGTFRLFSSAAMARTDVAPSARSARMVGASALAWAGGVVAGASAVGEGLLSAAKELEGLDGRRPSGAVSSSKRRSPACGADGWMARWAGGRGCEGRTLGATGGSQRGRSTGAFTHFFVRTSGTLGFID